jgi:hypothetical protein
LALRPISKTARARLLTAFWRMACGSGLNGIGTGRPGDVPAPVCFRWHGRLNAECGNTVEPHWKFQPLLGHVVASKAGCHRGALRVAGAIYKRELAESMSRQRSKQSYEYDVALSFAGEDRPRAEELAKLLIKDDVKVFYDEFLKATLWGKDLYQHLARIYKERAQYCVVFVSKAYVSKNWTKHELQHAQARSFGNDREYILPLRIDDTVLPGLAPTIGYLDIRKTKIVQVSAALLEKLGKKKTSNSEEEIRPADWAGEKVEYNGTMVASFWPKRIEAAQHKPIFLVTRPFDRIRYGKEEALQN